MEAIDGLHLVCSFTRLFPDAEGIVGCCRTAAAPSPVLERSDLAVIAQGPVLGLSHARRCPVSRRLPGLLLRQLLLDAVIDLIAHSRNLASFSSSDPTNAAGPPNGQCSRWPIPGKTPAHRSSALAHTVIRYSGGTPPPSGCAPCCRCIETELGSCSRARVNVPSRTCLPKDLHRMGRGVY